MRRVMQFSVSTLSPNMRMHLSSFPRSNSTKYTKGASIPFDEEQLMDVAQTHSPLRGEKLVQSEQDSCHFEHTQKSETKKIKPKQSIKNNKPDRNTPLTQPVTLENQYQKLAEVVTPLCDRSYSQQLRIKGQHMTRVLQELGRRLRAVRAPCDQLPRGLPCPLEPPRPSPELIAYRNKDEFGIHFGVDGNPKTVGFFVGRPTDPLMVCVPPTYLINMRDSHKEICQSFQNFIQQSPYGACHRFDVGGTWRNLLVRSTRDGEKMGVVYIHPQDMHEENIQEIMEDLRRYFFEGEGSECNLSSLYLQACKHTRCSREQAPYRHIAGKDHITETCMDMRLQISPDAFFQVNTLGAEVLYETVREVTEVSPITTLLDVCCGAGSISLMLAPYVRGTVGIDSVSGAIDDAKRNSDLNCLYNTQFFTGKAERVLPQIARDLSTCSDVVAVVNPARAGLHPDVIHTIRHCPAITKLVYVSCNPEGYAMNNFVKLGTTREKSNQKIKTAPFVPKYAIPVDMFPHTDHTELVLMFERVE